MTARARTVLLRDPRPGDMGWVVQQHGAGAFGHGDQPKWQM